MDCDYAKIYTFKTLNLDVIYISKFQKEACMNTISFEYFIEDTDNETDTHNHFV